MPRVRLFQLTHDRHDAVIAECPVALEPILIEAGGVQLATVNAEIPDSPQGLLPSGPSG